MLITSHCTARMIHDATYELRKVIWIVLDVNLVNSVRVLSINV